MPLAKQISLETGKVTAVLISPEQLKLTNKIFAENNMLVLQCSYLRDEVSLMTDIYKEQSKEIGTLRNIVISQEKLIANDGRIREELEFQLKQERKRRRKTLFGSIGVGSLAVIGTILILN